MLVLGGTTEGRELAAACAGHPELHTVTSLAGRTGRPVPIAGRVRIGGFGGVDGLVDFLRDERIGALVDATHTFAATMTEHAVAAARRTGVPLLMLRRPGWRERPGDRWTRVPSLTAAATALRGRHSRVFLTTGRQGIGVFTGLDRCWFLARSVEPPLPPMPARMTVILDRGPFTVAGERDLMTGHRIDVLVTKDSGGADAKLSAARDLGVPVIMVDRPSPPPGVPAAATVDQAMDWLRAV
ncbi:precorrin-6A reductase [Mangrovihabitans endophyticus]|uniref:Precorrin-6A reductase n=1 Tax=Mangrovihabitans endophyticus TaxID=1751298 RepID=A0A8J3FSP4_9ACTN|nr:precorrin-6A reductase [Mangrovihabitans endophyticus]